MFSYTRVRVVRLKILNILFNIHDNNVLYSNVVMLVYTLAYNSYVTKYSNTS